MLTRFEYCEFSGSPEELLTTLLQMGGLDTAGWGVQTLKASATNCSFTLRRVLPIPDLAPAAEPAVKDSLTTQPPPAEIRKTRGLELAEELVDECDIDEWMPQKVGTITHHIAAAIDREIAEQRERDARALEAIGFNHTACLIRNAEAP